MTEEYKITSSPSWKWMAGMLATDDVPLRIVEGDTGDGWVGACDDAMRSPKEVSSWEPDLTDPATQGAIIFGIFQPLGIDVTKALSSLWFADCEDGSPGERAIASLSGEFLPLPKLITAVFEALDKVEENGGEG